MFFLSNRDWKLIIVFTAALSLLASAAPAFGQDQNEFMTVIRKYASLYQSGKNELQKSYMRAQRKPEIRDALGDKLTVRVFHWYGTIKHLWTDSKGDAGLSIDIGDNISIKTQVSFGKDTMIPMNSTVYKQLMNLSEGTRVIFSGPFVMGDMDYIAEDSWTEAEAMEHPEFLIRFEAVEPSQSSARAPSPENIPSPQATAAKSPELSRQPENTGGKESTPTRTAVEPPSAPIRRPPPPTFILSAPRPPQAEKDTGTITLVPVYSGPMGDFFITSDNVKTNMELFASSGCFRVELHTRYKGEARATWIRDLKRKTDAGEIVPSQGNGNPDALHDVVTSASFDMRRMTVTFSGKQSYWDTNNSIIGTKNISETYPLDSPRYVTMGKVAEAIESTLHATGSDNASSSKNREEVSAKQQSPPSKDTALSNSVGSPSPGQEKTKSLSQIRITAEQLMQEYRFGGHIDSDPDPRFKGKELIVTGTISVIRNLSHRGSFLGFNLDRYTKIFGLQTSSPSGGFVGFSFDDEGAKKESIALDVMGIKSPPGNMPKTKPGPGDLPDLHSGQRVTMIGTDIAEVDGNISLKGTEIIVNGISVYRVR